MSKKASESPMSFFSFQDIMACVTGIMVLVALILALDPLGDVPTSSRKPGESQEVRANLRDAQSRVEVARAALAAARSALEAARTQPQVTADQIARLEKLLERERAAAEAIRLANESAAQRLVSLENEELVAQACVASAEEKIRAIKADLDSSALRARVQYQPGAAEALKPLLLEVTPDAIVIGTLDEQGSPRQLAKLQDDNLRLLMEAWGAQPPTTAPTTIPAGESEKLDTLLQAYPRDVWYALVVIRADAVPSALGLRDLIRSRGYEIGWQLWDASDGGFFDVPKEADP